MAKYALLIDKSRCTGCSACSIACGQHNQLGLKVNYNRLEFVEKGSYPNVRMEVVPVQCMHCDVPPCGLVCPTQATYKREDGLVLVDANKCIGCYYCMTACPYDARNVNEDGIPEKCRWCIEYLSEGEQPPCSSTCMNEVRLFGDIEDPNSELNKKLATVDTYQLIPEKGTQPRIYYVKK